MKNVLSNDLQFVQQHVFKACALDFDNLVLNPESAKYSACSFVLTQKVVVYREANCTPKKIGQFVAIWKRNELGITAPFDASDVLDFMIISVRMNENLGHFVFPKAVLISKGIVSKEGKSGKRGIRVYPAWETPSSKQAIETQAWQSKHFILIPEKTPLNCDTYKKLFSD